MSTYSAIAEFPVESDFGKIVKLLESLAPEPTAVDGAELVAGGGFVEIGAYFEEAPDLAGLALIAKMHGADGFKISKLPDLDWVAKVQGELVPVTAGRFFVYGSHDIANVPDDVEPLLIEASMAFGTGHHETTLGCLLALDCLAEHCVSARRILDLGCGTAVLAIAASRIWPDADVIASDMDEVAVDVAISNVAANNAEGRVVCIQADGLDHVEIASLTPFNLVLANILKGPLVKLSKSICKCMAPNAHLVVSGILNDQSGEMIKVFGSAGLRLIDARSIGEWSTLTFKK